MTINSSLYKLIVPLFFLLFVASCTSSTPKENKANKQQEDQQLLNIIAKYDNYHLNSSPFNNPEQKGNNAILPDLSPASLAKNHQALNTIYQELKLINSDNLSDDNKINLSVLSYRIKNTLDNYTNKEHYMPLTAESGFHVYISYISEQVQFKKKQDYQDYLSRLAAIPNYFNQQEYWMREGIKAGIVQPKIVLIGFEDSIKAFIKEDVTQSTYYTPFLSMSEHISDEDKTALQQAAKNLIRSKVIPTYKQYYQFMVDEYKPNARDNIAASSLPGGKAYYQNRVDHYTTINLTADEIHQQGLEEVKRIRTQMEAIIKEVEFNGSFADFIQFLRTDEQFYAKTPNELIKEASYISKEMDARLPPLFKTLPRTPYGVMAVPENIAPKYTTGRYAGPSRDGLPGYYWVNTYRLDRRPLYVLPALTLHEAVPGHHLQISLANEMKDVPEFRNRTYISAFGEGWGLYSEYLGIEAGMYKTPYENFGRLTYEMWRACRLVVDTGMHQMGWTRDQAINYLSSNTALSLHNVKTEIDRYISWPAQALSYKIGEITIKRLRQKAEDELGDRFDIREFHDQILKNGSMPLSMLEAVIDQYIEQEKMKITQV
jgi:uncharacterized protein (DUF885 family)